MIDKEIEDKIAKGFNLYASYPGVPRRIEQILAEAGLNRSDTGTLKGRSFNFIEESGPITKDQWEILYKRKIQREGLVPEKEDNGDEITNPGHYCRGKIDPWTYAKDTFTHAELIGAFKLNIIKYIHRFQHKGTPLRDLQKARAYLDQLIALYDH